ncbi:MAG: hypothetical protein JWL69_514 [Phycisphaerales bacterium]|nr:hypothetical protein [Phycisphaerales bacterium]
MAILIAVLSIPGCGINTHPGGYFADQQAGRGQNAPPGSRAAGPDSMGWENTADGMVLHIGGATITVTSPADALPVSRWEVQRWVQTATTALTNYFGHFPVPALRIEIASDETGKIHHGVTYGGKLIRISLGRDTRPADLAADWEMTHEMFHLAFPDMDEKYLWMHEGLSDYLEPLARARIGDLAPEQVWAGFVEGMPQGQPEAGDRGLDVTHTWGRTYWGGAIFWLLADVKIREQTHNQKSLDDAIKAILAAGGDGSHTWPLDRVLSTGDRATGTTVLKDLHDQMGAAPVKVDLDGLWKRLGIRDDKGTVTLDDSAPLADIRKSMTR